MAIIEADAGHLMVCKRKASCKATYAAICSQYTRAGFKLSSQSKRPDLEFKFVGFPRFTLADGASPFGLAGAHSVAAAAF